MSYAHIPEYFWQALIFVILALIGIFFLNLLTFYRALSQVQSSNQEIKPNNVWLMFIPLFSSIYAFILYPKLSDSIRNEYQARGLKGDGDFGKNMGIAMAVLGLCGWIPVFGGLASLTNFVLFIIFWVKIGNYRTVLKSSPKQNIGSSREDLLD